jgi:lipopolysaccharide/colanic/teichoic acid biosynthesis glycosyltransferase
MPVKGFLRTLDFFIALVALLALSPLMALLMIAGYFDTGSPVFRQTRVGFQQQPFDLLKFRSMKLDTASVATHLADEAAITGFGKFLRRTKLDELPQLINVLKGEMCLVGPRPCLFNQQELIEARQKRGIFDVRPGVTGLAQVNGVDMSDPERLAEWDQRMIASINLSAYVKYLMMTVVGKGSGDRVRH